MQKYILLLLSLSITLAREKPESYIDFIDTSIGTGGHGTGLWTRSWKSAEMKTTVRPLRGICSLPLDSIRCAPDQENMQ